MKKAREDDPKEWEGKRSVQVYDGYEGCRRKRKWSDESESGIADEQLGWRYLRGTRSFREETADDSLKTCFFLQLPSVLWGFTLLIGLVQSVSWDAEFGIDTTEITSKTTLEGVNMLRMLLYPPSSQLAFVPAAYHIPTAHFTLTLSDCSIQTLCTTVSEYEQYLLMSSPRDIQVPNSTSLLVRSWASNFTNVSVSVSNVTLVCSPAVDATFKTAVATVNTSLSFKTAMAALFNLNFSGTIYLNSNVNASYESGWPLDGVELSPGSGLTLTSTDGSANRVLDFQMSANVIQLTDAAANISNLTLVNLCSTIFYITPQISTATSFLLGALNVNWTGTKYLNMNNNQLIVPRQEMQSLVYWTAIYPSVFQRINNYAQLFQATFPDSPPAGYAPNADVLLLTSYKTFTASITNVALVASDAPPPQLANITIQPPTLCSPNSTQPAGLLPASVLNNNLLNPFYQLTAATNLSTLFPTLIQAALYIPQAYYFPPLIMQFNNISLSALPPGVASLTKDTVWTGPSVPAGSKAAGSPGTAILDFANMSSVVTLGCAAGSGLYMQRLTFKNLIELAVGDYSNSSLPLWGFNFNRSLPCLNMDSMTFILPLNSYGQMYALVKTGGPMNLTAGRASKPSWSALQASVLNNITQAVVASFSTNSILLSQYSGWGLHATNLLILPDGVYVDDDPANNAQLPSTSPPPETSSSSGGSGGSSWQVIVGVVVGVGGALLISAAVALVLWIRRGRSHEKGRNYNLEGTKVSSSSGAKSDIKINAVSMGEKSHVVKMGSSQPDTAGAPKDTGSKPSSGILQAMSYSTGEAPSGTWDPIKEVQQVQGAVQVQGDEDKLLLLDAIGQGAFGTVYRGKWKNLDVAVKTVLFSNKSGQKDAPDKRAVMEAAVCTSIVHPNVVATYHYDIKAVRAEQQQDAGSIVIEDDVQESDWKLYLVQELCQASMADALEAPFFHDKNSKRPIMDLILNAILDVAKGMEHIHNANIIHGDLKPENVLLKQDPRTGLLECKITDFGLCMTLEPDKSHVSGFSNGTPFYMAPEIGSMKKGTKASDVFSFGIVVIELYKGLPPWINTSKGFSPNKAFLHPPNESYDPLWDLAIKCINLDPRDRPTFKDIVTTVHEMLLIVRQTAAAAGSAAEVEAGQNEPASLHPHVSQLGKGDEVKAVSGVSLPDLTPEDVAALRRSRMGQTQLHGSVARSDDKDNAGKS
ncbi:hypothetical protein CEUSTIGMA_g587.t1 [Chlamydomonas eustigma]|uniref:Protein kinase domain-containing protein n=1 Tax=Chlamydomonas eustigma TaxID=1157962 RepID=A0A250WQK4_9CHLO|nr:hypothetical protein CEUSTIGMA_g587.t1 [Chlamydomonas eustigma]|eukprot:GAX73134.1 hypothetical protein CEUSTIGMA_g587.t1 [Chlamydomonas eustigma]